MNTRVRAAEAYLKALRTAVAVLTPEDKRTSTLAGLLRRWSGAALAGTAGGSVVATGAP